MIGSKPLRFRFDKIDRFIRDNDETRHLISFRVENDDFIYRIRYLRGKKGGTTYAICHKMNVDSYDSLPFEKKLTFHVIILIKPVFNKDKNYNYNYNIFLEKGSYQLPKNNDNK